MKKRLLIPIIGAMISLTSCGQIVGNSANSETEPPVTTFYMKAFEIDRRATKPPETSAEKSTKTTSAETSADTSETAENSTAAVTEKDTAEKTTEKTTAATTKKTVPKSTSPSTAPPRTTEKFVMTTAAPKAEKVPPDSAVLDCVDTIEVYSGMTVSDLVHDTNTELRRPNKKIDTSELGFKKTNIVYKYDGKAYSKQVTYKVVDNTAPTILNSGWEPYIKKGQAFDLSSLVGYADNCDRAPELTYSGEVDTGTVGSYPIVATVTDSSGNSISWDLTVLVVDEIPKPEDNNKRITFQEFMDKYCYENVSYGIDVSAWQTNVDYEAVKSQGCEFVIMRMGYCYSEIKMDDYYRTNMENATKAGLDVGVYFYTTANTEEKAREQARWIVEQLDGRQLDYPVAFDWEEWAHFQKYGMSIHDLNEIFEAFCDELEKNGYKGMLYSSKNFLNNFWENRGGHSVWLAHYTDETDYDKLFAIWQASAYGRMDGIDGDVDMNIRVKEIPLD